MASATDSGEATAQLAWALIGYECAGPYAAEVLALNAGRRPAERNLVVQRLRMLFSCWDVMRPCPVCECGEPERPVFVILFGVAAGADPRLAGHARRCVPPRVGPVGVFATL